MNGGRLAASSWSSASGKSNPIHSSTSLPGSLHFCEKLSMRVYCHPNSESILRKLIKAKNKHFHPLFSLFLPQRRITVCSAMENRKHLLIPKLSWHRQTGHVLLAKPARQALFRITDFSHRSQDLQCLYHLGSYAKAAHGEFNCKLLSMKKRQHKL